MYKINYDYAATVLVDIVLVPLLLNLNILLKKHFNKKEYIYKTKKMWLKEMFLRK